MRSQFRFSKAKHSTIMFVYWSRTCSAIKIEYQQHERFKENIFIELKFYPRNLSARALSTVSLPALPFPSSLEDKKVKTVLKKPPLPPSPSSHLFPLCGQSWMVPMFSPQQMALQMSVKTGTVSLSPVFRRSVTHWVYEVHYTLEIYSATKRGFQSTLSDEEKI